MPECHPIREDQAEPVAAAVLDAMRLIEAGASPARLHARLLELRVPVEQGVLVLNPDHAVLLANQLPRWANEPGGAELAGQAITLFLLRRTAA